MAINPRKQQLVCGVNGGIMVFDLDPGNESYPLIVLSINKAPNMTQIIR
jgi:hypothetical protein